MGFRFRRTFRLVPGVRLNLSKSGVSASIGTRGAWLTFGKRGTRATVGIPGTGISYTETLRAQQPVEHQDASQASARPRSSAAAWLLLLILLAIAAGMGWLIGLATH